MEIKKAISNLKFMISELEQSGQNIRQQKRTRIETFQSAISAMQELQQYRERIEELKHAEVIQFRCKLSDGRICHFSDFIEFLEKGVVE